MISDLAFFLVALVAGIHLLIAVLEMFFWLRPWVHNRLDFNGPQALKAAPIVRNAGLYNGYVAAGLAWGLLLDRQSKAHAAPIIVFFLICVMIVGAVGAYTLDQKVVLALKMAPAAVALLAVMMSPEAPPRTALTFDAVLAAS